MGQLTQASHDSVLRFAAALMLRDNYLLTLEERYMLAARLHQMAPLAREEGKALWAMVLRWATARKPTCVEILRAEQERWEARHDMSA